MAAYNQIYSSTRELRFDQNVIHKLFQNLKQYANQQLGLIMQHANDNVGDNIIINWLDSPYSNWFKNMTTMISNDMNRFEFEFHNFNMENDAPIEWVGSVAFDSRSRYYGLLNLVKNLIIFSGKINSDQMAKLSSSAHEGNNHYMVIIRPLLSGTSLFRDLQPDTVLKGWKGDIKLYNVVVDREFHFCAPRVLYWVMKEQKKEKNWMFIPDIAMTSIQFLDTLKELEKKRKMLKSTHVYQVVDDCGRKRLDRIYPDKSISKDIVYNIVMYNNHIWTTETKQKKRTLNDCIQCDYCHRLILKPYWDKHEKACRINASLSMQEIAAKEMMHQIKPYTLPDFDNIEAEYTRIKGLILKQIFQERKSIYIQGPGGNGKTFLINDVLRYRDCESWVLTPTGIAANDYHNGCTWHSKTKYMQLTGQRTIDWWFKNPIQFQRAIKKSWGIVKKPYFIVLEEISMYRGIDIRFISMVLKLYFESDKDFADIPVIVCGDPGQLEPVCIDEKMADLYFTCDEITQIRHFDLVVEMNHPRRLMPKRVAIQDIDAQTKAEICRQFNIQQQLRLGQVPRDFFNVISTMQEEDFFNVITNPMFISGNDFVVIPTYSMARHVLSHIYRNGMEQVGLDFNNSPLYICNGMKLMVCDNQAFSGKIRNGSSATVIEYQVNKWVKLDFGNGDIRLARKGIGSHTRKGNFPLSSFHVRTVHKTQGVTIQDKMYFYSSGQGRAKFGGWCAGQQYTLFSRCTNMKNIVMVYNSKDKIQNHVNSKTCWTYDKVCQVISNPKCIIGRDIIVGRNGCVGLRDTRMVDGFIHYKDKRIVTKCGMHYDRFLQENEKKFDNMLNIDHETRISKKHEFEKHVVAFTSPIWYFNGQITRFDEFLLRNNASIQGLQMFEYDESCGAMIFSDQFMDDPMECLFQWIMRIFELVDKFISRVAGRKVDTGVTSDILYFIEHPIVLIGFNNLGYDDRFMIQKVLTSTSVVEPIFVKAGGTTLKNFKLRYSNDFKGRIALTSYDIMQIAGVGTLDRHISSNVTKVIDQPSKFMTIHSRIWLTGFVVDGTHIFDDFPEFQREMWNDFTDPEKKQFLITWGQYAFMNRAYMDARDVQECDLKEELLVAKSIEFAERCQIAGKRDELFLRHLGKRDKKGCCALKLYTKMTAEECRATPIVDLISIMDDGNGGLDWSQAFFPREIPKARQMLKERGIDFFKQYPIVQEIQDYGINDVVLNDLLLRRLDNTLGYEFASGLKSGEFTKSWNGHGLSILRFETTSKLCMQFLLTNLPDECLRTAQDQDFSKILPKYPIISRDMVELVRNISGGKTQARRLHFQSIDGGVEDWLSYNDFSGMYMAVQERYEYPFGHFYVYSNDKSPDKIDEIMQMYTNGSDELFKRCRLFKVRAKCKSNEIENVVASKGKVRLLYTNEECEYVVTNYELKIMHMFDVDVLEFIIVMEWDEQTRQFESIMKYLSEKKRNATDSTQRGNAKLIANASFGSMNQKDKLKKIVAMKNINDVEKIHSEYPSGIQNRQNHGDYLIGIVEDSESSSMRKPCYIGAFTLGASKDMLYSALFTAMGGQDRFQDLDNMIGYGDTDSVTLHRKCISRLVEHDDGLEEKDRWMFNAGDDSKLKAGKFTDELSDDGAKYFGDDYVENIDPSWPNFPSGYHVRIIESFNPQSKSGGNMFITPPTHWIGGEKDGQKTSMYDYPQPNEQEWQIGYKCFAKGVSKDSILKVKVVEFEEIDLEFCDRIKYQPCHESLGLGYYILEGLNCDASTYYFLRYSYAWSVQIETKRPNSIVKKVLLTNSTQEDKGIGFGDVYNINDVGRNIWGKPDNGRNIVYRNGFLEEMKQVYREDAKILNQIDSMSVQEWARMGYSAFTISRGHSVPYGYNS